MYSWVHIYHQPNPISHHPADELILPSIEAFETHNFTTACPPHLNEEHTDSVCSSILAGAVSLHSMTQENSENVYLYI